ncbi:MAG: hypothetical protein KDE31_16325, partial [Caldilineaceae bacterium]|nr:hypothetical protein [Caldilineaceae bacterium]
LTEVFIGLKNVIFVRKIRYAAGCMDYEKLTTPTLIWHNRLLFKICGWTFIGPGITLAFALRNLIPPLSQ